MGSRNKIKKKQLQDGIIPSTGSELVLDTTNFNDNLDSTITNVQKLADKVDDLNTVHIYDELPLEIEGQIAYAQGKFYGGNGSEWNEFGGGGGGLPSGTVNQTLRHNGTEWVTTANSSLTDGDSNTTLAITNNALPLKKYIKQIVTDGNTQILLSGNISNLPDYNRIIDIQSTETASNMRVIYRSNQQIDIVSQDNYQMIRLTPNTTTSNSLRFYVTKSYNPDEKLISFSNYISIYQNGKIFSDYYKGTGTRPLVALEDGTIQRSTATIPDAQIQSDWNQSDNTQVDYIKGKPVIPQGESVNIETLTANKTLTASDATVQIYTSTANRVINLPTTGLTLGQKFEIWNNNDAISLITIKQNSTVLYQADAQTKIELRWNGTNWITEWKYNISIGNNAYNNYYNGIGIGRNAVYNYSGGVGIGLSASYNYTNGVGIGVDANNNHNGGIGIGPGAGNNHTYGIGIGGNASGNSNYSIGLGAFAGNGQSRANTLYIHSSTSTVGANSLIYGEFDNRIVRINNTLYVNDLVGTGDRPIVADSTGKLKIGTAISGNTPLEYLSANLSGTEHTFNNATLGITGDLRTRIKFIDVYAVDSDGNWNSDLIDSKFVYENDITINSTVSLGGSFKIRLYIEYV